MLVLDVNLCIIFVILSIIRKSKSQNGYVCRWKCGKIFNDCTGRIKHERTKHYKNNPLEKNCDICGKPCIDKHALVYHRLSHLSSSERSHYRCSFCHHELPSIKSRQRHEQIHKVRFILSY